MSGVDIAGLVERARAFKPYNHLNDGALVRELTDALLAQAAELAEAREAVKREAEDRFSANERCNSLVEQLATSTRQRDEALAALKASEEREAGLREALEPFALVARTESKLIRYSATGWNEADMTADCARAFSVLENSPAALADATNNPPSDPGSCNRPAISEGGRGHSAPATSSEQREAGV